MRTDHIANVANHMIGDMERQRLKVTLRWTYEGAIIRQVDEHNPNWYQRFCAEHSPSRRTHLRKRKKPDTIIKRQRTLQALHEIRAGKWDTLYAERLMPYIRAIHNNLQQGIQS